MNKSYKSILNRSTGTYVAASENVKSAGKSAKNKLAMKVASASLAFGASVAMLSPMEASADESVPASSYQVDAADVANATDAAPDEVVDAPVVEIASPGTGSTGGTKRLGSQMLGATLLGVSPTSYNPFLSMAMHCFMTLRAIKNRWHRNRKSPRLHPALDSRTFWKRLRR
jgi:hypothetical protein